MITQHSSNTVEHFTPENIVQAARATLGTIDLDPASCELANRVVGADKWFGPGSPHGEDGLAQPWSGNVFLNPPGGRVPPEYKGRGTASNAALWWAALANTWHDGGVHSAVFVGFTLEVLRSAQALDAPQPLDLPFCVPKRRIAFDTVTIGGNRTSSSSPTHANVIVYLPPVSDGGGGVFKFLEAFAQIGRCRP